MCYGTPYFQPPLGFLLTRAVQHGGSLIKLRVGLGQSTVLFVCWLGSCGVGMMMVVVMVVVVLGCWFGR